MEAMESARRETVLDGAPAESQRRELSASHDPMLSVGQRSDVSVTITLPLRLVSVTTTMPLRFGPYVGPFVMGIGHQPTVTEKSIRVGDRNVKSLCQLRKPAHAPGTGAAVGPPTSRPQTFEPPRRCWQRLATIRPNR
jgi:hypothetical protein